jgi:hypothetical protein
VPIGDLIQQVWIKVFHMESRYFAALYKLFIPGQVSIDYFKGFRKRYPPPVQFFFVVMFLFVIINNQTGSATLKLIGSDDASLAGNDEIFERMQERARYRRMGRALDSMKINQRQVDTFLSKQIYPDSNYIVVLRDSTGSLGQAKDSMNFRFFNNKSSFREQDFFELTPDQIIEKYDVQPWYNALLIKQAIKTAHDPNQMFSQYIGSFAWALFVMVIVGAGLLKLLYIRRGRYYVEHLIYLLHQTSADWLLITLVLALNYWLSMPIGLAQTFLVSWFPLSMLVSMYRFYGQGIWKTLLKWFIFIVLYVLIGVTIFSLTLIVTMLLL